MPNIVMAGGRWTPDGDFIGHRRRNASGEAPGTRRRLFQNNNVDRPADFIPIADASLNPRNIISGVGDSQDHYSAPTYEDLPSSEKVDEWKYVMRRTMQEITPGVFLGKLHSQNKSIDK